MRFFFMSMSGWLRCTAMVGACLFGALSSPARGESPGKLLRCVQERYGTLADLSARFDQESRMATLGRTRTRSGRIVLQAKGKMRWEYDPPDQQLVVSDGATVWFYRPEQRQVIVQKIGAAFSRQTPLLFLFGKGDFATDFTWEEGDLTPAAAGTVSVVLRPRVEAPDLVRLVLEVEPGTCRLAGTSLEDGFGNLTRLVFSAERTNAGAEAALFRFTAPPGTEVVRP